MSVKPVKPKTEQSLFNYFGAKKNTSGSEQSSARDKVVPQTLPEGVEAELFDDDDWLEEIEEPQYKKSKR